MISISELLPRSQGKALVASARETRISLTSRLASIDVASELLEVVVIDIKMRNQKRKKRGLD